MPTVDERLRHVTLKIKRAKEHISDLEREISAFLNTNPYGVSSKRSRETGQLIYYVSCAHPIPESIALVAGDAIQNLAVALDHLAYQLVCSDTGDAPPEPDGIYFPIRWSASEYESRKKRKMLGAAQETFDAIDALKPYKGGNDLLFMLNRLNSIEKHRLLFTVGAQAAGMHLGHLMAGLVRNSAIPAAAIDALRGINAVLMPADKGFPMKEGFELLILGAEAEPDPQQQFHFTIALNEPGIAEGKPLLETLHQLTNLVEGIVTALTPRLK